MLKRQKWTAGFAAVLVALFLCLALAVPTVAATGDGDGSGGGKDQPLQMLASDPANGATGVAVSKSIKLSFNKNVVNMTVSNNNRGCFKLFDGNGQPVSINIIMGDDQLYPEQRRDIVVDPMGDLQPGTGYKLVIDSALTSKSTQTLGETVNLKFTTAGEKQSTGETTDKTTNPGTVDKETNKTSPGTNTTTEQETTSKVTQPSKTTGAKTPIVEKTPVKTSADKPEKAAAQDTQTLNPAVFAGVAIVVCIVALLIALNAKKNRK